MREECSRESEPGALPTGSESAVGESAVGESAPAVEPAPRLPRTVVALACILLLAGVVWFVRTRSPARPANVPRDAAWVDGVWISCQTSGRATEWDCFVFSDTGALLHSGIYHGLIGTDKPHIIGYRDGRITIIEGTTFQQVWPTPPTPPIPVAATLAGTDTPASPFGSWGGCIMEADSSPFHLTTITDTVVIATTPLPDGVDIAALLTLIPVAEKCVSPGDTELPDGTIELSFREYELADFNIPARYGQMPGEYENRALNESIVIVLLTTNDTSTVLARVCTPVTRQSWPTDPVVFRTDLVVFRKEEGGWRAYLAGSFTIIGCG